MTTDLCPYRTNLTGSLFYRPVLLTEAIFLQLCVGYGTESLLAPCPLSLRPLILAILAPWHFFLASERCSLVIEPLNPSERALCFSD
jgi:hypothetical protein